MYLESMLSDTLINRIRKGHLQKSNINRPDITFERLLTPNMPPKHVIID